MENQGALSLIYTLQNAIFNDQSSVIPGKFADLSAMLVPVVQLIPDEERPLFKQILLSLVDAYQSGDFLLLADLLEYELKPLLKNSLGEEA